MPSAPLHYTPLLIGAVRDTPIGQTTVGASSAAQLGFAFQKDATGASQIAPATEAAQKLAGSDLKEAAAKSISGIAGLVDARAGGKLGQVNFALDDVGFVSNRTMTTMGNHPEWLDTASIDDMAGRTGGVAKAVAADTAHALAAYSGGTLDLGAPVTAVMMKAWAGKEPVAVDEAAAVGFNIGREVEKAVTPTAPDTDGPLHWIDGATSEILALWPGAVSKTAAAVGVVADPAKIEEMASAWRVASITDSPNAMANKSLHGLLALAGVDAMNPEHVEKARVLLQGAPLEGVPTTLAAGIVDYNKLDPSKLEWVAARIEDIGGRPGNVGGLAAEIDKLKPPPPPAPNGPAGPPVTP